MNPKKYEQKPQFMCVYYCPACQLDSGMCELDEPHCHFCETTENLELIDKQPLSPEVMAARVKVVNDRMMSNLEEAFAITQTEGDTDEEGMMLELLAKAQQLGIDIEGLDLKKKK